MRYTNFRHAICQFLSALSILLGACGMVVSFLFMASVTMADITAGASGFVAGSVLVGAGILSLTMLARPVITMSDQLAAD